MESEMAQLPTVKLQHRKTGKKTIINVTDYQRDIAKWSDWKIITTTRGDATLDEVRNAQAESDENKRRLEDPAEAHKRGDKQRTQDAQSIDVSTAADEGDEDHGGENTDDDAGSAEGDTGDGSDADDGSAGDAGSNETDTADKPEWMKGRWPTVRTRVKDATGTMPKNWEHAKELMAALPE